LTPARNRLLPQCARRIVGGAMVVGGALLMWFAPDTVTGAVLLGSGIALEIMGIALEHCASD
jgi:hypothetical protein